MGLLEQEIYELRRLKEQFKKGEITDKQVKTLLLIYSETDKRIKSFIQAHALDLKLRGVLSGRNLIGDGDFVDQKLLGPIALKPKIIEDPKNPCRSCDLINEDKNNPECMSCDKRMEYLRKIKEDV